MKTRIILVATALLFFVLQSCKMENTPEEYFDITSLNTNLFMEFGARDFKRMGEAKSASQLMAYDERGTFPAKSYEDHILRFKIPFINQAIEKIKDLKPTEETTPMINASLDLFNYVKEKYQTDYVKIARLMDNKAPKEEIEKAIFEMETVTFATFDQKYKKLWDLALPYAKEHGIEVKTF